MIGMMFLCIPILCPVRKNPGTHVKIHMMDKVRKRDNFFVE